MASEKWRLIHAKEPKKQTELTLDEVVKFLSPIPASEREQWYVWKTGMAKWCHALDCSEIRLQLATVNAVTPPPFESEEEPVSAIHLERFPSKGVPPPKPKLKSRPELVPPIASVKDAASENDRRKHPRFKTKFRVVIVSNKKTYRGYTTDISMGGLQLEKALPWTQPAENCHVFLMGPSGEHAIEFRAKVVSNPKNSLRIAFQEADEKFKNKLAEWLAKIQKIQSIRKVA